MNQSIKPRAIKQSGAGIFFFLIFFSTRWCRGYLYKEQGKTSVKKGVGIGKLMSKFTNTHIQAAVQLIYLIPNFALSSFCKASLCTII